MSWTSFGTWWTYTPPKWEEKLTFTSDPELEKETGLNREQIERILTKLTELGIVE